MTDLELAQLYATTDRTIRRWKAKSAPLDRPDEMPAWIASQRSRRLVSKTRSKAEVDAPVKLVPLANPPTPQAPEAPLQPVQILDDLPETELARAEHLERIAARIAESGDAKAVDAWAKASAERRRIAAEIRDTASAITEGDAVLARAVCSIFDSLAEHFEAVPHHVVVWMLGSGSEANAWEERLQEFLDRIIGNAVLEVWAAVRGTPLQPLFEPLIPSELEAEMAKDDPNRKDFLKRPIDQRQADTITN
jgi:hypothetical protein